MAKSSSSSPRHSSHNPNRETRSERNHGHWRKIFKFTRKKDVCNGSETIAGDPETKPQLLNGPGASQQDHLEDRKRVKSLRTSRSRSAMTSAPRSGKFFSFNTRTYRRKFLKKASTADRESKGVDVENEDATCSESFPSPISIVLTEEETENIARIQRKRLSLSAIRHTRANSTMMFARENLQSSPQSLQSAGGTRSETRDDLWLNSSTSEEKDAFNGLRARSLLDISDWPSFKQNRHSSIGPSVPCDTSLKTKIDDNEEDDEDVEVVSVQSDSISDDSQHVTTSGGSRIFSFRCFFRELGSEGERARTSHVSLGSTSQNPPKDEPNRLLLRRSSSLPQNIRINAGATKAASNPQSKRVASSDDGLQCPWGVKATKKEPESLAVRNNVPLTFRIADISSALNFTGKRGNSSSSESINLSDDDYEGGESNITAKQDGNIEMQHDDFIEYTVKMAKKQRK